MKPWRSNTCRQLFQGITCLTVASSFGVSGASCATREGGAAGDTGSEQMSGSGAPRAGTGGVGGTGGTSGSGGTASVMGTGGTGGTGGTILTDAGRLGGAGCVDGAVDFDSGSYPDFEPVPCRNTFPLYVGDDTFSPPIDFLGIIFLDGPRNEDGSPLLFDGGWDRYIGSWQLLGTECVNAPDQAACTAQLSALTPQPNTCESDGTCSDRILVMTRGNEVQSAKTPAAVAELLGGTIDNEHEAMIVASYAGFILSCFEEAAMRGWRVRPLPEGGFDLEQSGTGCASPTVYRVDANANIEEIGKLGTTEP